MFHITRMCYMMCHITAMCHITRMCYMMCHITAICHVSHYCNVPHYCDPQTASVAPSGKTTFTSIAVCDIRIKLCKTQAWTNSSTFFRTNFHSHFKDTKLIFSLSSSPARSSLYHICSGSDEEGKLNGHDYRDTSCDSDVLCHGAMQWYSTINYWLTW